MEGKGVVTVSRQWHHPAIKTTITAEGITIQMDIADFTEALLHELDSVAWTFTKKQLREKVEEGMLSIIQGMKEETAKVV